MDTSEYVVSAIDEEERKMNWRENEEDYGFPEGKDKERNTWNETRQRKREKKTKSK